MFPTILMLIGAPGGDAILGYHVMDHIQERKMGYFLIIFTHGIDNVIPQTAQLYISCQLDVLG